MTAAVVSARQKVGIVTMIVVAVLLAWAAFAFVPRPDITLQDVRYTLSGCTTAAQSQHVTAGFTLLNRGPADGTVRVQFYADDRQLGWRIYSVPAHAKVPGEIASPLLDCGAHRYSLSLSYEAPPPG